MNSERETELPKILQNRLENHSNNKTKQRDNIQAWPNNYEFSLINISSEIDVKLRYQ